MKTLENFFENGDFTYLSEDKTIEPEFIEIWERAYKPSQDRKILENNIPEQIKLKAFNGLSKRGKFLCQIYDFFDCKNIAEVGTAEGFQFFTFCDHLSRNKLDHKVYSCDIRDVRSPIYTNKYGEIENFVFGTSKEMAEKIVQDNQKIDLFWIDGGHHTSAVLNDVIRLAKTQSSNCMWIFDDFNERFGLYQELKFLSGFSDSHTLSLGPTASGKPNNMMLLRGPI